MKPRGNSGDETLGNGQPRTGDMLHGGHSEYPPPPTPPNLPAHYHRGPPARTPPQLPGPVLPANFHAAMCGPSWVRAPPPPIPESPSLSLHPASLPALPGVGQRSRAGLQAVIEESGPRSCRRRTPPQPQR
ncbi:hypothetical protein PAL_GLEAN10022343 [Pteropus alecto]|uniref:Uncharacterized protein n=1 Tax=Pteropus alecto TaxID=9402 RepID=L5JW06_PTEAL|nr:hypothetical protein PAL_GLEAN10022343 [Pteropus alecto]